MAERLTVNQNVGGSNPSPTANRKHYNMHYIEIYSDNINQIPCANCLDTSELDITRSPLEYDPSLFTVSVIQFKTFWIYNNSTGYMYKVKYNRCKTCFEEYINIEQYSMSFGDLIRRNVPLSWLNDEELSVLHQEISKFNINLSQAEERLQRHKEYFQKSREGKIRKHAEAILEELKKENI